MINLELGSRIKIIRKAKKLTLRQLSCITDLSISYLSDIENNRKNPSLLRLKDIAKNLDTSVNYLLTGQDAGILDRSKDEVILYEQFLSLLEDEPSRKIISALLDIKNWNKHDKNELLTYLTIKQTMRDNKNPT